MEELFDRTTQNLCKIKDEFQNTYIFSLPKDEIAPTDDAKAKYRKAMNKGDLVAYKLNDANDFRKPHTDEKLEKGVVGGLRFLSAIPVGETISVFLQRIEKIMNPAAAEILKGKARGADKLATLNVEKKTDEVTYPPEVVLYRNEPLTKKPDGYYRYTEVICIHCKKTIPLQSMVYVKNGRGVSQRNKESVNGDASRVEGEKYKWAHHMCRDKHLSDAEREKQKELDQQKNSPPISAALAPREVDHVIEVLNSEQSAEYKVAYLTGYFRREKELQNNQ